MLPLMGNMFAIAQAVLFFIMLQVFLYNAYQASLPPLWLTAVIVLAISAVILVVSFVRIVRRYRSRKNKSAPGV
jgi:hypothetical protein